MLASHLVEVNELSPPQLCSYIESKHYVPIKHALEALKATAENIQKDDAHPDKITIAAMLFIRLKDEMEQLMRNDLLILFPLIAHKKVLNSGVRPQIPVTLIRDKNKKILVLLEKVRQMANNYILKPEWSAGTRMFYEDLFTLDQMISQAIYLKENVLLPKLAKAFD